MKVEFDSIVNFHQFISGTNVVWIDGGIMDDNNCQWVLFFGTAEDIVKVQTRFQIAFRMLEKRRKIERALNIEISGWTSNSLVE